MSTAVSTKAKTNISGQKFGRWDVGSYVGKGLWVCVCACGVEKRISTSNLTLGKSRSCGCLSAEITSALSRTHGLTQSRAYRIWAQMRGRCNLVTNHSYPHYGGRGIKVCERWENFENFLSDMGHPPDGLTLDRTDNDGDYTPGNCKWKSRKEQSRNKRSNVLIEYQGKRLCISDVAEAISVAPQTLGKRIREGWPIDAAINHPVSSGAKFDKLISFKGESLGLCQWAKKLGIHKSTLANRFRRGWTIERALTHV